MQEKSVLSSGDHSFECQWWGACPLREAYSLFPQWLRRAKNIYILENKITNGKTNLQPVEQFYQFWKQLYKGKNKCTTCKHSYQSQKDFHKLTNKMETVGKTHRKCLLLTACFRHDLNSVTTEIKKKNLMIIFLMGKAISIGYCIA